MPISINHSLAFVTIALKGAAGNTMRMWTYLRDQQLLAAQHGEKWLFRKIETLAEILGVSYDTAHRSIQWLEAAGVLIVWRRSRQNDNGEARRICSGYRVALTTQSAILHKTAVAARSSASAAVHAAKFISRKLAATFPNNLKQEPETWKTTGQLSPSPLLQRLRKHSETVLELTSRGSLPPLELPLVAETETTTNNPRKSVALRQQ